MDIAKDIKSPGVVWLTLAGGLLYGLSSGICASYGVFLGSIAASSGVDYASLSFIVAVGQLLFGLLQPLFGVLANAPSIGLMPFYLLALLALMIVTHEQLCRR